MDPLWCSAGRGLNEQAPADGGQAPSFSRLAGKIT